jgi:hypothetical protein
MGKNQGSCFHAPVSSLWSPWANCVSRPLRGHPGLIVSQLLTSASFLCAFPLLYFGFIFIIRLLLGIHCDIYKSFNIS